MRITAEPRSDQQNAEDFLGGPRTFTIESVQEGTAEQKYDIKLEGEHRVWRPPLTVLRTLIKLWGNESAAWIGQRVTLYNDEAVTFGKDAVGGIRISHASGINEPVNLSVTKTRGKKGKVTVQPLRDAPDPIEKALTDSWDDPERMRKAVAHLAEIDHPRHKDAADRLAELEGAES